MIDKIKGKGISPLVTTVLVIMITVIGIALVLTIGVPVINRAKEAAIINEATQNMRALDNTVREVASEGVGALRSMSMKVSGGEYSVNQKANSIDFVYYVKYGIVEPGTFTKEGNLIMTCGVNAKASEYDLDGDGADELVLENEILRVGIQKNGTVAGQVSLNTSRNIKILNFIENNVNVTPADSSVILDSYPDSSYGTGYSQLVKSGDHLARAEALVHMNTTSIVYDIVYSLQSGADFLVIRVQNAYYK